MKAYVAMDIGCLECSQPTHVLGSYPSIKDAAQAHPKATLRTDLDDEKDWHGDAMAVIFEIEVPGC